MQNGTDNFGRREEIGLGDKCRERGERSLIWQDPQRKDTGTISQNRDAVCS